MTAKTTFGALLVAALFSVNAQAEDQTARERAEIVIPEGWQKIYENWKFAPALKIDNRIYVSGVVAAPRNGDLKEGYRRAWRIIEQMLVKAGASLDDIVEMTTFHTNLQDHLEGFGEVKNEFIKAPYPSWTGIGITELAVPNGIVEIKVIAHVSDE